MLKKKKKNQYHNFCFCGRKIPWDRTRCKMCEIKDIKEEIKINFNEIQLENYNYYGGCL